MKPHFIIGLNSFPSWILVVVLFFGAVYARSLTFVYIEGDDAASVAYHAMGRDRSLQPPFNAYHSGMDLLLSLLPAQEEVLRISCMVLTGLAAAFMVLLMLSLVFDLFGDLGSTDKVVAALALMLAVPEYFYLGLAYMPTVFGMSCAIAGHLLLRGLVKNGGLDTRFGSGCFAYFLLAAILVGLGAACRWDVALYGWVIFVDLAFSPKKSQKGISGGLLIRLGVVAIFGGLAIAAWYLLVLASGYGLRDILGMLQSAGNISAEGRFTWLLSAVHWQSVLTPACVVVTLWGVYRLYLKDRRLLIKASFMALPLFIVVFLTKWPPKLVMMFFPGMLVFFVAGISDVWSGLRAPRMRLVFRAGMATTLLIPWVIGVRATYADTAWGPGFGFRSYDRPVSASSLRFALFTGSAVPTQEGERAVWGHGGVLLGGSWREHVKTMESERMNIIDTALNRNIPIICLQGGCQYIEAELSGMGYKTTDPSGRLYKHGLYHKRVFIDQGGRRLTILISQGPASALLKDERLVQEVIIMAEGTRAVAYGGDPSAARLIYLAHPESMKKIGDMSAIVDLAMLTSAHSR